MPFFQTLDRTCFHLGSLSDLSWKMVAKRESPGAPKIPVFLCFFKPSARRCPGPLQDPPPRRLRGSFFDDFGTIFTISDQQKHYFGDHSLIILAFIFTISDQRKHYFGEFLFDNFGINSYGFWSTKALQQTHTHAHTHPHIHIHLHKHISHANTHATTS